MKILVVEDAVMYHQVAIEALGAVGFEVVCVSDIVQAIEQIGQVDAVITDLYFYVPPCGGTIDSDLYVNENEPPAGLMVALACERMGKPYIIFSETNHHKYSCWFVYGASRGYDQCKPAKGMFPYLVDGDKTAARCWHETLFYLLGAEEAIALFDAVQEARTQICEKYPGRSREKS